MRTEWRDAILLGAWIAFAAIGFLYVGSQIGEGIIRTFERPQPAICSVPAYTDWCRRPR